MTVINDLTNRVDRLNLSYGRHIVTGTGTKHVTDETQALFQRALGWASFYDRVAAKYQCRGWHECENLYYQGFEIPSDHYTFHSGGPADAVDAYFPEDIPHPRASYLGGKLPDGMKVDNEPDNIVGIFKTTKVADYNEDGDQIDEDGDLVVLTDPDDALFYSAKPALEVIDAWRRTRRGLLSVNWPAWCDYRDYCATLIDWDDGALTPHQVSLVAGSGGSLAAATYCVRIATLKGGDISSASKDRANDGFTTASIPVGASGKFTATWASQEDRGATGYRVYVGTAEGGEDRYFVVGSGAINTLEITTLVGATMGAPPEIATGSLLRQIPRFESHIFMAPPFDFITFLDKIAQITCMDWQYAGGLLNFFTPEIRAPVFTVNMAEVANFKTYRTDRRQKPNQILVNYRNLDDQFLAPADPPVQIDRRDLQDLQGVKTFTIDMGCAYRSQAERVGEYWAKRLIDSDQMIDIEGSPKTYIVLPGDKINITHEVPDWTDVSFYIETKEEPEDTKAGYPMTGRLAGAWYSDTDHNPLPRALPPPRLNPFSPPPVIDDCVLTEELVTLSTDDAFEVIRGAVTFAAFVGNQRGRIWVKGPSDDDYKDSGQTITPNPGTLQSAFEIKAIETGEYSIKVVTESDPFGVSLDFADHPAFIITVTGDLLKGPEPTDLGGLFYEDIDALLIDWTGQTGKGASKRELYDLQISVPGDGDFSTVREVTIDRAVQQMSSFIPWEFDSADDPDAPGPGTGTEFELVAPGGFNATVHPGDPHWIALRSRAKAVVFDELVFQFEIAADFEMPFKIGIVPYDEDPDTSEYGLWWGVGGGYGYGDAQPDGEFIREPAITRTWITADGTEVHPILAGNRPAIVIGRNRIPRFVLNYEGGHSVPVIESARKVKVPGLYIAYAYMTQSAAVRNANWLRSVPEYVYDEVAQRADNSALLPDEIKWRVRQHSFYTSGPPSDWVYETSNR